MRFGLGACRSSIPAVVVGLLLFGWSAPAFAQPGQPTVRINGDFSVTVSYSMIGTPPAFGAWLVATYNGAPVPGSPFNIGSASSVTSGPVGLGTYSVYILWGAQASPATTFSVVAAPPVPFMRAAAVDLNIVQLAWDPGLGASAGYDLEAIHLASGMPYFLQVGEQSSLTVRNVPPGRYSVRVRARNAYGVSAFSNAVEVIVGRVLAVGDLQATLTWNTTADIDLHMLEPDLSHVFWGNMHGTTGRLDFDDRDGFGPENIFVARGRSLPGFYQIYVVHAGQNVETTSTIAITLGVGSSDARTAVFTRRTRRAEPDQAVLVAMINVQTGELVEMINGSPLAALMAAPPMNPAKP